MDLEGMLDFLTNLKFSILYGHSQKSDAPKFSTNFWMQESLQPENFQAKNFRLRN